MRLGEIAAFVVIIIQNVLSIIVSATFFVGIPIFLALAWREGTIGADRPLLILAEFWAYAVGWFVIYAEVIYHDRYMMPVTPFMIFGGLTAARSLWSRHREIRLAGQRPH